MVCHANCHTKRHSIPFSGHFQRAFKGRLKTFRSGLFWASFGAFVRLPSCFFCSPLPSGVKRPKTGQIQASIAHVDKRAATAKNAPTASSESFSRPHEKGPKASPPGTGNPSARTQKKAAKPAARRHFPTLQPPRVNFLLPPGLKTSPRCKANVNQCKLFSHFVLNHSCALSLHN